MTQYQLLVVLGTGKSDPATAAGIDEDAIKASFAVIRRRQQESVH